MIERQDALENWLRNDCGQEFTILHPMPSDASFRRYFRIHTPKGSYVVMDAKPEEEDCHSYIAIAKGLRHLGLHTPEIFYVEEKQGFMLISDFGEITYLKALNQTNADQLYTIALHALLNLQACRDIQNKVIPLFTSEFMWREWQWCKEWFLGKLLNLSLNQQEKTCDTCYEQIVLSAISQSQVFMHRDFHSNNLMVLPNRQIGILDFQDAFIGPVTYDLVSLLRDCYINWPEDQVKNWVLAYWKLLHNKGILGHHTQDIFLKWFDWMGIERHLKALFTFSRKYIRDNQAAYLKHIPRTLNYVLNISQKYVELEPLHHYFYYQVQPALQTTSIVCEQ